MKRCKQCRGPIPPYITKHPDLRHMTGDQFCQRRCAELFHGVQHKHVSLGMYS